MHRTTALTVVFFSLLCQTGFAFQGGEKAVGEKAMQERELVRQYKAALKLTPEQLQKIHDVRRKWAPKQEAVWARFSNELAPYRGGGPKDPEGRAKYGKIMKRVNAALAPVLAGQHKDELALYTPEQRKLADAWDRAHPALK